MIPCGHGAVPPNFGAAEGIPPSPGPVPIQPSPGPTAVRALSVFPVGCPFSVSTDRSGSDP
jgi:hypothetical protein